MRRFSFAAAVGAALALSAATAAHAGNVEYNFNTEPFGWYSAPNEWLYTTEGSNEKSWKLPVTGSTSAASYLYSPCFISTDSTVQFDFNEHRFNFGVTGTTGTGLTYVPPAGQVQYSTDGGMTWSGIPLADWSSSGVNVPPTLDPASLSPTTTALLTSGYAFQGMSLGYDDANPKFIKSSFTLTSLTVGGELQFRLLGDFGGTAPAPDPGKPAWDVDNVQIKGVIECVPEPGTLALAGIGGLCCLLLVRQRRRVRAAQAVVGSTAATIVVVVVIAAVIATATPTRAESTSWNFKLNNGGWIATGTWGPFPPEPDYQWKWVTSSTVSGGTSPHWAVRAQGVSPSFPSASFLTSPTFSTLVSTTAGPVAAQAVRISLAHDFFMVAGTTNGIPTTLGQLQYRLNPVNGNGNGGWTSLPLSAFTNGGSVLIDDPVFGASPFKSGSASLKLVNQSAFVAPNYVTPNGAGALPYVTPARAAFTGASPGWPTAYVPSQAFLTGTALVPAGGISSMQVRLTNLNLAANCSPTDGWNVRFVQVDYLGDDTPIPPVPEPGALALAATGVAALLAAGGLRRRRHQRPSSPRESP